MSTIVVIPTYNEVESIGEIVDSLKDSYPKLSILVVDDNSLDGTASVALAAGAQVLHRSEKQGLGLAYLDAFQRIINGDYGQFERIIEMDGDGSHQIASIQGFLDQKADLVIGARWIKGGSVVNWPWHRRSLSRFGNLMARVSTGMPFKDSTSGFRCFHIDLLKALVTELENEPVLSGYGFQIDLVRRSWQLNANIVEIPIQFIERRAGRSKMGLPIVREAMARLAMWWISRWFKRIAQRR